MTGAGRKLIVILIFVLTTCCLYLLANLLLPRLGFGSHGWLLMLLAAFQGGALLLLWYVLDRLRTHFQNLDRLHGAVVTLGGAAAAELPEGFLTDEPELGRLADAITVLSRRSLDAQIAYSDRMERILAARSDSVVVVTEQGQVSLVNPAAMKLLGAERVRVGTSVFAALERKSLLSALTNAHRAERPIETELRSVDAVLLPALVASLGQGEGGVLSFAGTGSADGATLEHDLTLHDQPPVSPKPAHQTPLAELPALVLDCETTGLDVQQDRIVSIGAVRLHGSKLFPSLSFDSLVNPGMPIPSVSRKIHGISDDMVRDLPGFAEVYSSLQPLLKNCVVIGHNVSFDLAMLRREFELAGLPWQAPAYLDTFLLAAMLDPESRSLELEALASEYGVDVHGRHTALGDSLVTAEIYCRMLPRLAERGIKSLVEAQALGQEATHLTARQKAAGW